MAFLTQAAAGREIAKRGWEDKKLDDLNLTTDSRMLCVLSAILARLNKMEAEDDSSPKAISNGAMNAMCGIWMRYPSDWEREIDVSYRVLNILRANDMNKISTILLYGKRHLRRIRGLGPKSVDEISKAISDAGYELRG